MSPFQVNLEKTRTVRNFLLPVICFVFFQFACAQSIPDPTHTSNQTTARNPKGNSIESRVLLGRNGAHSHRSGAERESPQFTPAINGVNTSSNGYTMPLTNGATLPAPVSETVVNGIKTYSNGYSMAATNGYSAQAPVTETVVNGVKTYSNGYTMPLTNGATLPAPVSETVVNGIKTYSNGYTIAVTNGYSAQAPVTETVVNGVKTYSNGYTALNSTSTPAKPDPEVEQKNTWFTTASSGMSPPDTSTAAKTTSGPSTSITMPGPWQTFSVNGFVYQARQIKTDDQLTPLEKTEITLRDNLSILDFGSGLVPGGGGEFGPLDLIQVLTPPDPRWEVAPGGVFILPPPSGKTTAPVQG
ncbi:MAG TPA: hypothetical protein VGM64_03290 [Lacunisphaera sp.]|jgi:hypothetical protein